MDNNQIADHFSLLSKLMDIHGENTFKSKSYSTAAYTIEKLQQQLSTIPIEKIATINGIGSSSALKIIEIIETGKLNSLEELINKTPKGVIEMLNIKGVGPKKINTIWKEMEIETIGELLYACKENRLKLYKGFGEKTQQNVIETIEFYFKSKGSYLYAQVELIVPEIESFLLKIFNSQKIELTGAYKRQLEIIDQLEFLIEDEITTIEKTLLHVEGFTLKENGTGYLLYSTLLGIDVKIYIANKINFIEESIKLSSSDEFWQEIQKKRSLIEATPTTVEHFFQQMEIPTIPPYLREQAQTIQQFSKNDPPQPIEIEDIKGIIHSHSNWSDGSNTIEEMANAAISKGFEYLVISDHSKSAFYAQGLSIDRIIAQHQYIDELNKKIKSFKIYKSIESDILNDGNLDYPNEILSRFDLVIASIHSNLKMNEEKAMMRLIKAIENPFTTILGHMTGRLLLSRPGYPVDHKKIIDACAANKVVIELNAHPSRLDIDWRQLSYALEKNVLISINPDAHQIEGMNDVKYGVKVAQKAMLPKERNLSSFTLDQFEDYITSTTKEKTKI